MNKILRALMHFPVGVIAGLLCVLPAAAVLFTMSFMVYELNEDWRITDHAYIDIFGFLIGFPFGAGAAIIWKLL